MCRSKTTKEMSSSDYETSDGEDDFIRDSSEDNDSDEEYYSDSDPEPVARSDMNYVEKLARGLEDHNYPDLVYTMLNYKRNGDEQCAAVQEFIYYANRFKKLPYHATGPLNGTVSLSTFVKKCLDYIKGTDTTSETCELLSKVKYIIDSV